MSIFAPEMEDTFRHQGMRRNLIAGLREKGISDEKVLTAMMNVPRHAYMDKAFLHFAYEDTAFPIGAGQTISQPYTVAFQTQLLELQPRQKVLEIGTGSGYQCAVLCELGVKVFSVERQKELYERSSILLKKLGYKPKLFFGDGYKGLPAFAPFDAILVTCGAPFVPETLLEQIKPGGRLVIPVGEGDTQRMKRIIRKSENEYVEEEFGDFRFVPMLKDRE
jgi:protein-L-isoaspartate(D-aspartate) O-methyltransferase